VAVRSASNHQWRNNGLGQSAFDLGPTENYYTRPMSGGWSRPREVRQLADTRARFEFDIPVAELPGISTEFSAAAPLHARLEFGREQGLGVAQVALRATLGLTCQRCLQALAFDLDTDSRVALVANEAEAAAVPEAWETFLAEDGLLRFPELIAEEVLLALPIVPLHVPADCALAVPASAAALAVAPQAAAEPATTRPFADLKALLERGGK
jgi:uncharacterized protein